MDTHDFTVWSEQLRDFALPRYEALPDIELYMDQVIGLLNKYLAPLYTDGAPVTASMINNYVKLRLLPPPVKKKYNRLHLAYLIVITVTKQVMPITEARLLLQLVAQNTEQQAYNDFCTAQEQALRRAADTAMQITQESGALQKAVQNAVVCATADKMFAQKVLSLYTESASPAEEKPAKEKAAKEKAAKEKPAKEKKEKAKQA